MFRYVRHAVPMPDHLANYAFSLFGSTVESLVGRVLLSILAIYAAVCVGCWGFIPPVSFLSGYFAVFFVGFGSLTLAICNLTVYGLSVLFLYSGRLWLLIPVVIVQAFVASRFAGIFGMDS